jgi:antitoxin YefM
MKTATVTEFKKNAKEYLQEVADDRDILIISRPKKQEGFVVLAMSEYESLTETAYLLSSPANAQRLLNSIKQVEAGKAMVRALHSEKVKPKKKVKTSAKKTSRVAPRRK